MGPVDVVPWAEMADSSAWDAFVDSCDDAWFGHTSQYCAAIGTWPTRSNRSVAAVRDGRVLAVLPLHVVELRLARLLPFREIDSHGGPALSGELSDNERAEVGEVLRRHLLELAGELRATTVRIRTSALAPSARNGSSGPGVLGVAVTSNWTWLSDLGGGPDLTWQRLQGRARTSVRKAEKLGVTVRRADADDLAVYYDLHVETYARTGVPPHPRAYFEAIWRDCVSTGISVVLLAEHDGRVVAAQNFALHKDAAWYWTGAAGDAGLRIGANALLQWRGMCLAMDRGLRWFDHGDAFPGATGKMRGLSEFKRSFGGDLASVQSGTLDLAGPFWRTAAAARDRVVAVRARTVS